MEDLTQAVTVMQYVLIFVILVAIALPVLTLFFPRLMPIMRNALEQQEKWTVMWSNFKETDADLQRQIDDLKRELEEMKKQTEPQS